MFIRKLFNIGDKAKWLALELLIVFVGVYLAFVFQNYSAGVKERQERDKVFSALKYELEFFRVKMPGRSSYSYSQRNELLPLVRKGEYDDFSDWRFIEPQYNYKVVEYAMNLENTNIVDFPLYDRLQGLYTVIKRLEHAESLMMQMAQRYRMIPQQLAANHPEAVTRHADNLQNFGRFLIYLRDRASNQQLVANESAKCLDLINSKMDPETRMSIESELILGEMKRFESVEEAIAGVRQYYPDFPEGRIRSLFSQHKEKGD